MRGLTGVLNSKIVSINEEDDFESEQGEEEEAKGTARGNKVNLKSAEIDDANHNLIFV